MCVCVLCVCIEGGEQRNVYDAVIAQSYPEVTMLPKFPAPSWVDPSHISHECPCSPSELLFQRQSVLNQVLCFGRGMEPSFLILLLWERVVWVLNNSTYKYIFGIWPQNIYIYAKDCLFQGWKNFPCTAQWYQLQVFLILILFKKYHIICQIWSMFRLSSRKCWL